MEHFSTSVRMAPVREALRVVGLPNVDVEVASSPPAEMPPDEGTLGVYNPRRDLLWVSTDDPDVAITAAVHEYAHAIWQRAAKGDLALRTKITSVLEAIQDTEEILRFEISSMIGFTDMDYNYLLNPNEEWARAVAQYVFTRSDQTAELRQDWQEVMKDDGLSVGQWSAESFRPIAAAITAAFPQSAQ